MIIDCHTHIFPFGFITQDIADWFKKTYNLKDFKFGIDELIKDMDENKVEKSIVLPLIKENEFEGINDYMGKIQKKWSERIICFGTINPKNITLSLRELKKIKQKLELKGIKLHPTIQEFYPNDERLFKIYELAEKLGLPILFHSGFGGLIQSTDKYSQPIYLDEVACSFNELKIIIGHGGRYFYDQTAMLIRKHKNIYTEISTSLPKSTDNDNYKNLLLIELLRKIKIMNGSLKKVFFGSDFPFRTIPETIELLESVKNTKKMDLDFSPMEINDIFKNNIINKLGHIFNIGN
ncbi:MAG: amidohydrolase family protein [Actinobacteria bacterium]|nr:amidohydrolase family protein [Actinomycetota bacterium]